MTALWRLLARINQWPLWRREVELWDHRLTAVTLDRLLNLYLHRLGLMNAGMRSFLQRTIRPGMNVIDLGANQGLFTLLFSQLAGPTGRVVAFEPDPELFSVLEENCRRNHAANVTLRRSAVGSRSGSLVLHRSLLNAGDNRLAAGLANGSFRREQVMVETLDDAVGDSLVDFIKMDVQGWEWEAVRGMENVLERNQSVCVLFEFWPSGLTRAGCQPAELLREFRARGFSLNQIRGTACVEVTDDEALCRSLSPTAYTDLYAVRPSGG